MTSRINIFHIVIKTVFVLGLFSFVLLYAVSFKYYSLGSDGGWYSYPALSLSRGGDPTENTYPLDAIEKGNHQKGLIALFPFQTYKSIRIFYTALWFKNVPVNIINIKLLSLIECLLLIFIFYYMLKRYIDNKIVVMLFLALFINDKSIILSATSDFRPDLLMSSVTMMLFIAVNNRKYLVNTGLAVILICIIVLIHLTSVISLIFILCYMLIKVILEKQITKEKVFKLIVLFISSFLLFIFRDKFFEIFFTLKVPEIKSLPFAMERIIFRLTHDIGFLFFKEYLRWKDYFILSNIMILFILMLSIIGFVIFYKYKEEENTDNKAILYGLFATAFLIIFIDPHGSSSHLIPIMPFLILFMARQYQFLMLKSSYYKYFIILLIFFNIIVTNMFSYKIYNENDSKKYNITDISLKLNSLYKGDQGLMVIGPTELWPYFDVDKDITIIDFTRTGENMEKIKQYINKIDFVILNSEYEQYWWAQKFKLKYPEYDLIKIDNIEGGFDKINIYSIKKVETNYEK